MADLARIEFGKGVIEPIVQAHLQMAIVEALGKKDDLIASAVKAIMNSQVDSSGAFNSRGYDTKPLITWMMEKGVREAALEAVREWFAGNRESIKRDIMLAIAANKKQMAEAYVLGICEAAASTQRINVSISITK